MKKLIYSIAFLVVMTFTIGCKKTNTTPVVGFWAGTAIPTGLSTTNFEMLYKADGSLRAFSGNTDTTIATSASGTYVVSADSVRASVVQSSTTLIIAGKQNGTNMKGTFYSIAGTPVTGTFDVTRQ